MNELNDTIATGFSEWQRGYNDCDLGREEDRQGCGMYKDGYRKRLKELADEDLRIG
jgi:hypothetical protein